VGFVEENMEISKYQESAWMGGKENDLVICFGVDSNGKASWSYVFGRSMSELAKKNIETLFLTHEINDDILYLVSSEIMSNYENRDWSDFDHISIEPSLSSYIWLIVVMLITQGAFWMWAHNNDINENPNIKIRSKRRRNYNF
jgi:hypothetical protein